MKENTPLLNVDHYDKSNEFNFKLFKIRFSLKNILMILFIFISFILLSIFSIRYYFFVVNITKENDKNSILLLDHGNKPPFPIRSHPIVPQMIDLELIKVNGTSAIPTNEWWTNFIISDSTGQHTGEGEVTSTPYTIKSMYSGVHISYAGKKRREITKSWIKEIFQSDIIFTSIYNSSDNNILNSISRKRVIRYDPFIVDIQYDIHSSNYSTIPGFKLMLARGSPYITVKCNLFNQNRFPVIVTNGKIISIKQSKTFLDEGKTSTLKEDNETKVKGKKLIITFINKNATIHDNIEYQIQTWIVYTSKIIEWKVKHNPENVLNTLILTESFQGYIRIASLTDKKEENDLVILNKYANVIPVRSEMNYNVSNEKKSAYINFTWKTDMMDDLSNNNTNLLMLAFPHQVNSFAINDTLLPPSLLRYRTVKGYLRGVLGERWILVETVTEKAFHGRMYIDDNVVKQKIQETLLKDIESGGPAENFTDNPYYFGKDVARKARMVLVAEKLLSYNSSNKQIINHVLSDLRSNLTRWLEPFDDLDKVTANNTARKNRNFFVFDNVWGGLCSNNGIKGVFYMTDFGNGWYSDHHFHYGYYLYALAVVGQSSPEFLTKHKSAILALIRDIANPSSKDNYFPPTRYFSWFDGHSFASGIFLLDGGKSQESVSEAINAYYAVYLIGLTLKEKTITDIGLVLLAQEIRAAKTYWQMRSIHNNRHNNDYSIYEEFYAENKKMNGQISCTKVTYNTWFGDLVEYIHLINMIPFTPITEEYLEPLFVEEEYPILKKHASFNNQSNENYINSNSSVWKSYSYLDYAVINPSKSWDILTNNDLVMDDGNSLTNSLDWIATRPNFKTSNLDMYFKKGY